MEWVKKSERQGFPLCADDLRVYHMICAGEIVKRGWKDRSGAFAKMNRKKFDQTGPTLPVAKRMLKDASETGIPGRVWKRNHSYGDRIKFSFTTCIVFLALGFPTESDSLAHIPQGLRGGLFLHVS